MKENQNIKEFSVDVHDLNFLMIYGKHINGYYMAVPNWYISCELGESESVSYNAVMIAKALKNVMQDVSQEERNAIAKELAQEIKNSCN